MHAQDNFISDYEPTIGVEFRIKAEIIRRKRVKWQIWDLASDERFSSVVNSYYRGNSGCFVVYDITNRQSFTNRPTWIRRVQDHVSPNVTIILVGNKLDEAKNRQVTFQEGFNMAVSFGLPFMEVSAKNGTGLALLWAKLASLKDPDLYYINEVEIFLAVILLSDDYLSLKPSAQNIKTAQFFRIGRRLPIELQMVLCLRVFDKKGVTISSVLVNQALRDVLKSFLPT